MIREFCSMDKLPAFAWLLKNTDCTLWDRDKDGATVILIARCGRRSVFKRLLRQARMPAFETTRSLEEIHLSEGKRRK